MDQLIQALKQTDSPNAQFELDVFMKAAPVAQIFSLVAHLIADADNGTRHIERIFDKLLLEGFLLQPEELVTIVTLAKQQHFHLASIAAKIAVAQPLSIIDRLAGALAVDFAEFLACLLHEVVIDQRRLPASTCPNLSAVAQSLQTAMHPLHVLPLELLSVEIGLPDNRQEYFIMGSSGYSASTSFMVLLEEQQTTSAGFEVTELTTAEFHQHAQAAFAEWSEKSNGKIESRRFKITPRVTPETLKQALLTLNLACLTHATAATLYTSKLVPESVVNVLFRAAANGGAYNRGLGNVYGRLAAWQSAFALVNAPPGTSFFSVNARIEKYAWFGFNANSPWFWQVARDVGIVGLNQRDDTLVILAATDTD